MVRKISLKKFKCRPSTFQENCPWYSRGANTFRETFAPASIFLPISVLGYM